MIFWFLQVVVYTERGAQIMVAKERCDAVVVNVRELRYLYCGGPWAILAVCRHAQICTLSVCRRFVFGVNYAAM